ncbi:hypothetical protein Tco_0981811 [Tanacetum coccineum]
MDNPNITMEEYIRLQDEKALSRGKTFDWQTATHGKMKYCEDEDDCFTNFESKFPAIVLDDTLTSSEALLWKPTVSPLNNKEIDFKISFDESDDEDYMNDKVNMPSSPSPEPTIGYIDDLDFFKDFENEFPAIAYNDDLKSKSDPLIEPSISSRHIDKFDSKNETSLVEYDEEEQNVLYFNDSFPLNVIFPNNLKTIKGNDDDIDITQPSRNMAPLPYRDQRHPWLRYQVEGFDFAGLTEGMRQTLGDRLRMIYTKDEGEKLFTSHAWRRLFEIKAPLVREFILEFFSTCRMSDTKMGLDVVDTLCFQLGGARRRMTWRQFILALGLDTEEEMAEAGFGAYWQGSERMIPDKGDLRDYWMEISSYRDFLGSAPSYVFIRDPVRRLCHKMIACSISSRGQAPEKVTGVDLFYLCSMDRGTTNVPHLLAWYMFRHAEGRKSGARLSGGHFIGCLAAHFGLVSDQG